MDGPILMERDKGSIIYIVYTTCSKCRIVYRGAPTATIFFYSNLDIQPLEKAYPSAR
jgi:hypothetical protein